MDKKKRIKLTFAALMISAGAMSVLEKPAKAAGSCCAPGNPYHCGGTTSCQTNEECIAFSGTCG